VKPDFVIHELPIPHSPESPDWGDFATALDIHYANEAEAYGTRELGYTALEALPDYLDQENQPTRLFVARTPDHIVGVARYEIESGDDPSTAWLMIDVPTEHRGRGIGAALSSWMQSVAHADAVRKFIVYTVSADASGERLVAPTGFGTVPKNNREVRFLLAREYRLEQVVRGSRLALPFDITDHLAAARGSAGHDYRLHSWIGATPDRWLADMAMLRTRMSTEEPDAGLDEPEDVWSVDRLIAHEARQGESPRTRLTVVVEHVPSATLAGFTALSVPAELERSVSQQDTLVLPEHRGHRLGMLLKVANIDHLQRERPGHPAITTFNAEENRPMLDVNEALGFVPIGFEGAWRKDLPK
jgi:GNAT superfamily N-acetyltransferase